jgi:hypothetical protein
VTLRTGTDIGGPPTAAVRRRIGNCSLLAVALAAAIAMSLGVTVLADQQASIRLNTDNPGGDRVLSIAPH